ncbi:MAG: S46 family peptidase [Bacteroidales bacterium]|nr:S46 family peptidase [Bacteroidales bacterium]
MNSKRIVILLAAVLSGTAAFADEGMWMVNAISRALQQNMEARGLKLQAGEIYNEDAVSLKDAILSLDFGCSGSIISDEGLVITNHHCAYSDVFNLSNAEHDYLEEGFWAMNRAQEVRIPGKSIYFLKRVLDVTDEVNALKEEYKAAGQPFGMRKVSWIMEKRYNESTGLDASLSSMWAGSKYYMALYEVYKDIRLVAAPPVSISAFGGDIDNWEWPQQKCDFALYRIYTGPDGKPADYSEDNIPMKPLRKLKICTDGLKEGDFTMVMGYPGRTDRYASSVKVDYQTYVSLPISNEVRGKCMSIIKSWMDADPAVRLKYSDYFFSLSNVQELYEGEVQCYKRFAVADAKRREEAEMMAGHKDLLDEIAAKYAAVDAAERNLTWYRETMIRGTKLSWIALRLHSMQRYPDDKRAEESRKQIEKMFGELDMRVEKELFRYCMEMYMTHVDDSRLGPYQKELKSRYGDDYDSMFSELWVDRLMTVDDGIYRFFSDVQILEFNQAVSAIEGDRSITTLGGEYTRTLYAEREKRGIVQYPDANSTMRLTYGVVGGYSPRDGILCSWQSTTTGILQKYSPTDHDFYLKPDWKTMLEQAGPLPANFLTDNDITGGNSGSPVMNARGELVGLAFDGNKESLASDAAFVDGYNKCVCVDIRYVLWTLKNYAHMDAILTEIGL